MIWLLCGWSKLIWIFCAGRKSLVFSVSLQIDLKFVWVTRIDLISVWRSNLTWIQCRMKYIWLLCGWSKMTSFQCGGSALIWLFCCRQKWLGFSVRFKLDLLFVPGSTSTSVLYVGRKLLGFNLWIKMHLFFSMGIEIDLVFVFGPKINFFLVCGSIELLVRVVEIGLVFVCCLEITWF